VWTRPAVTSCRYSYSYSGVSFKSRSVGYPPSSAPVIGLAKIVLSGAGLSKRSCFQCCFYLTVGRHQTKRSVFFLPPVCVCGHAADGLLWRFGFTMTEVCVMLSVFADEPRTICELLELPASEETGRIRADSGPIAARKVRIGSDRKP